MEGHPVLMQEPMDFASPTTQKLVTRLNLSGGLPQDRPMEDIVQGLRGWRVVGIGLGAAGLAAVVVGLVMLRRAKKKPAVAGMPGHETHTRGTTL